MKARHYWSVAGLVISVAVVVIGQSPDSLRQLLNAHQHNLESDGRTFLVDAASNASFLLLGGLHGDQQTQTLIQGVWPDLAKKGYKFIDTEISPWAAARLRVDILRGGDMEEGQPQLLIRELAALNPTNSGLESMVAAVKTGYRRQQAAQLLDIVEHANDLHDSSVGGFSLRDLIVRTLEVEAERAKPESSLAASVKRETLMKDLFLAHYRAASKDSKAKAMLVFGRNHLHRGYDRRGVSTLGNFVAELAVAEGVPSFHVAVFAAGGKVNYGGIQDIDERKDDPAFQLLSDVARYPATLFDLRPIRASLHSAATTPLSSQESSLLYWADSYDAIICYRKVTPLGGN